MTAREQFFDLVLRARNLLSRETEDAADSVENLAGSAEELESSLRDLEDQGELISQFDRASKAVDRTGNAYQRAQTNAGRLQERLNATAGTARRQASEFDIAEKAVGAAEQNYEAAQRTLADLTAEIAQTGVATAKQSRDFANAQRAVDRAEAAYDRAGLRVATLRDRIQQTEGVAARQAVEFENAKTAVENAERAYESAERTLDGVAQEAANAGVDITNLSQAQRDNARRTTNARRALDGFNKEVEEGDNRLTGFRRSLSSTVGGLVAWTGAAASAAAALSVGLLTRLTAGQADLARQTLVNADAFGIAVEALQEWQRAGEQVGLQGDKTADIMKDVAERIGDAYINGAGEALEVIRGLNLDLEQLARLSPDQQILAIGEAIQNLPRPAQIQILEALASDASLLLPLLDNNAAKLRELAQEAQNRGQIFSAEELAQLAEADRTFDRIVGRVRTFARRLAVSLAPALQQAGDALDVALGSSPELLDRINGFLVGLINRFSDFATSVLTDGSSVAATLSTIANTARGLGGLFLAAFRGVQSFAAGSLEVLTRAAFSIQSIITRATEGLNAVGFASDDAVARAQARLDNLGASVQDLEAQSESYKREMQDALDSATTAFSAARDGAVSVAAATTQAAGTALSLKDATAEATDEAERQGQTQQQLARQIAAVTLAIEAANRAWSNDPSDENLERIRELNAEYRELQDLLAGASAVGDISQPSGNGVETYRENIERATDAARGLTEETANTFSQVVRVGNAIRDTGNAAEAAGQQAQSSANSVGGAIGAIFTGWSNQLARLSRNAAAEFNRALGRPGATADASALEQQLSLVNQRLSDMEGRVARGGTIGRLLRDWATAGFETERSFLQQAIAVETLTERIIEGDRNISILRSSTEDIERQFDLLDSNQLSGLIGAVQSVRRELDGLSDSLDDTIASAQQELAALRGDNAEVERLRFQERQNELQEQLNTARDLGDRKTIAKAEEALRLSEEAFRIRLADAEAQADAAREAAARAAAEEERQRQNDEAEERQDISRTEQRTQAQTNQIDTAVSVRTVRLQFADPSGAVLASVDAIDPSQVNQLVSALERSGFVEAG